MFFKIRITHLSPPPAGGLVSLWYKCCFNKDNLQITPFGILILLHCPFLHFYISIALRAIAEE